MDDEIVRALRLLISRLDTGVASPSDVRLASDIALWFSGWEAARRRAAAPRRLVLAPEWLGQ